MRSSGKVSLIRSLFRAIAKRKPGLVRALVGTRVVECAENYSRTSVPAASDPQALRSIPIQLVPRVTPLGK
jgi:hypothetical protein